MNAAFLSMAAGAGMTSAIMNPLHAEEMTGIMGANVMNGNDPECRRWIERFREPVAAGEADVSAGKPAAAATHRYLQIGNGHARNISVEIQTS